MMMMSWTSRYTMIVVVVTTVMAMLMTTARGQETAAAEPPAPQVLLYSTFSWGQMRGNVTFSWAGPKTNVTVEVNVETAGYEMEPEPQEVEWGIHDWPVRYDINKRCGNNDLGEKKWDLSSILGKLTVPTNGSVVFNTMDLSLVGKDSIFGRSLRLQGKKVTCANIHGVGGEHTYEGRFFSPAGGSIWIRTWNWNLGLVGGEGETRGTQSTLFTDLFNTAEAKPVDSEHIWALYITDILDNEKSRPGCNFLQYVYDPLGKEKCDDEGCPQGDLTQEHGKLKVASKRSRSSKNMYTDISLNMPDLSGKKQLYVVVKHQLHEDHIYACSKIREIHPKNARAVFSSDGVAGSIFIEQISPFSPSDLTLDLRGLRNNAGGFHVHELPAGPKIKPWDKPCSAMAGHYNPYDTDPSTSPPSGKGSHDQYELGDLSGKHGSLQGVDEIQATVTDYNLPLFGPRSVTGRGIVIHQEVGARWVCGNLRSDLPMIRAAVTFRYPVVGEIIFEQPENDPLAETMVYIPNLVYSDGSRNDTGEHRWHVHEDIPGKDFYNWTMRCISAGSHYNPHKVSVNKTVYKDCRSDNSVRCEVGDLVARMGKLRVAGTINNAATTTRLFTDTNLPLTGPNTILGHSITIHDDNAPKHRGDRMACSGIFRKFRHKGVVNKWTSRRDPHSETEVEGKIEFIQESLFDVTQVEVDMKGLQGVAKGWHVHMVPVDKELEFPCAGSTTYGHFNPLNVTPANSPPPDRGTDDLYELGDLAGKYGTFEDKQMVREYYNDTNLPLFGRTSIMGRSVVIHKKEKNARWYCGSIIWGYAPSEATQVSAIASFHYPNGFAWGYIRMRQLVYNDGSFGETFIEVNLRHPGTNNRNITRGHNWSIYVNPVGVDAGVKFFQSRCVASGYRWNPFLVQLAFPNDRDFYERECSEEFPLRCDVGDLSGRLGPIDVGDQRYVFVDRNLPLSGPQGIMNRAVVIHNEKHRVERFACANIEPDDDIIKWANIRKPPKFSPNLFMDDMRKILGVPEWYLAMDLQTVKTSADHKCVTFVINFMGPLARQLEQDFSRLLAGGILHAPTLKLPGHPDPKRKKKVNYRTCGGIDQDYIDDKFGGSNIFGLDRTRGKNSANQATATMILLTLSLVSSFFFKIM